MRFFVGVWMLLLFSINAVGQEFLIPLKTNQQLKHQSEDRMVGRRGVQAVSLPFIDDFSNRSFYPNPNLWLDNNVFINSTLPIDPPTIGVATFDGLKANGEPYSYKSNAEGPADTLTSDEIDLSALTPADSVILSFFVEAKGNGDAPGSRDTFLLQFKVNDSTWNTVWSVRPQDVAPDSFQQFFIVLNKNQYFRNDFQFRFRNYASLTGNVDHWHLDYVILDQDRSVQNKFLNDVAYDHPPRSLLKTYQSMPLNQFVGYEDQELADSLYASATNHFNVIKNTTFRYRATENCTQSLVSTDFFQTINFPRLTDTILTEANFKDDIKSLVGSTGCDSLVINTRYVLFNSPPDPSTGFNDTIYHAQRFHNYLAYDDGTGERGFLVTGNSPKFAVKFKLNEPDSLQAIRVHFPHIDKNLNNELVNLIIWQSIDMDDGTNDSIRYENTLINPEYVDSLNGFYTYRLDSALYMQDSFYVGFQRSNADSIQVGYDVNSPVSGKLFFYTLGSWKQSLFSGTVMVRPVLGAPLPEPSGIRKPAINPEEVAFYPNPVKNTLILGDVEQAYGARFEIYNINGTALQSGIIREKQLDVSSLPNGIHLLRIIDEDGKLFYGKFVKVE